MQITKYRSLGCDVPVNEASSVEEYDRLAKKPGQCLKDANANTVYRGLLAEFRDKMTTKVEEQTSIEREVEETGKKDKDGNPIVKYTESEATYINRVKVEKGWTEDNSTLQSWADEIAAQLVFDPSAPERKAPTPKKVPKKYIEVAERAFELGKHSDIASQLSVTFTGNKDKDVQLLAKAIKADVEKAAEAELQNRIKGLG